MDYSLLTLFALYLPLIITVAIAAHTPGPNNIMLLQGCALFGFKKTHGHRWGVVIGFLVMLLSINLLLQPLIIYYPTTLLVVKILGSVFFLWFASKIIFMNIEKLQEEINLSSSVSKKKESKPFTFWQAFFFQWINVKAIFYALSLGGLVDDENKIRKMVLMSVIVVWLTISSGLLWSLMGVGFNKLIKHTLLIKSVNILLGLALLWFAINMWL